MGRELGRISGPLLADNLRRNGSNLAFDTQVLYLDVVNGRIGFNTSTPVTDVYTPNAVDTVNLIVDTAANIANFTIGTNNIQNAVGTITISPYQSSNPTIVVPSISATNLNFFNNTLQNTIINDNINVTASGTGTIKLNNNTTVTGNLHATGDITWDGDITFGNSPSDTVTFDAEVNSNILPSVSNTDDLGSSSLTWATAYINTINASTISASNLSTTTLTGSGTNALNGNVTIGTSNANTLGINARLTNNLVPSTTNAYNLGSSSYYWNHVYAVTFNDGNITASNNVIQTNTTNSNLRLVANGSGQVLFSSLNVTGNTTIGGTLGVTGTTTLSNNVTTGTITQTGTYNQTGNFTTSGTFTATGSITSTGTVTLPQIILSGTSAGISSAITGTYPNTNITITANGTGKVQITSATAFDNNVTVAGTLGVTGTTTFLNNVTSGAITQSGSYNITGNATLGAITSVGNITASNPLTLPTFTINGSTITGTANSNLKLTANTGQSVEITSATKFDNNASITGTLRVTGTSSLKNTITGTITQTGDYNLTGNYLTSGTISSGSITAADPLTLPSIAINGSVISGTANNTDLQFVANGTGIVRVQNNNVQINNNLSVGNGINVTGLSTITSLTVGDITQTGDFNQTGTPNITGQVSVSSFSLLGSYFNIGNFDISNQTITGTVSNGDVTYLADGTGSVWLGNDIKVTGNNIINNWINVSTPLQDELGEQLVSEDGQQYYSEFGLATALQDSLLLTPTGTGNVIITGTTALILPIGDDSTRVLPANGEIRFNDLNLNIEAFEGSGYVNFINLYSQDHNTYVTGELTPGAADNTMRFAVNGTVKTTITPTALTSDSTIFGNININSNVINNTNSSSNITFSTSGTGLAKFNGQLIASGNNLLLPISGGLTFNSTGNGYTKFTGNSGVVIPVGTNSDYPVAPVAGATRYNSDLNYGEVYNGTIWQPIGGSSAVLSQSQVDDVMYAWDLILG